VLLLSSISHSCVSKPTPPAKPIDYANAVIMLERTTCFGTCPAYTLTIHGDGRVEYDGKSYVKITGSQGSTISPDLVKDLVDAFYKIDYFSLQDEYRENVTDLPTTITSIAIDGKTKKVLDYGTIAPQGLKDLEKKIDQVAGTDTWVKGDILITLERTSCFGSCPAYKLTIHWDGKVEYDGESSVKVTGLQTAQISQDQVTQLANKFNKIGYFSLQDEYWDLVTDLQTTITSIWIDGRFKRVLDYGNIAPQALKDLERKIDEVAGTDKWVKGG
jgi:hypothetical protein